MDSDWLDSAEVLKMLDDAKAGRSQRLSAWLREGPLRCTSPDYSSLVLVRDHRVSRVIGEDPGDDEGSPPDRDCWVDLNVPAEPDQDQRQAMNFLWRTGRDGATWSRMLVPRGRRIVEVRWLHGRYDFQIAKLSLADRVPEVLHEKIVGRASNGFGLTEAEIADNFDDMFVAKSPDDYHPPVDWDAVRAVRATLPPSIEDRTLGVLTRDESNGWFQTTIVALGHHVGITVRVDEQGAWEKGLRRAASVVERLDDYVAKAKRYAAMMFLDLKNNNWLAEDEQPVSMEDFQSQMRLSGLFFDAKGRVEFEFTDGASKDRPGLFCGHWIVLDMRGNDRFIRVELEG